MHSKDGAANDQQKTFGDDVCDGNDFLGGGGSAADDPMVGGAECIPLRTLCENCGELHDHTTLVAAVKAGGLVKAGGWRNFHGIRAYQCSVCQVTSRHGRQPVEAGEQRNAGQGVLRRGCREGQRASDLMKHRSRRAVAATLKTVNGETLTATMDGKHIVLTDQKGDTSTVTIANGSRMV